MHTAAIGSTAVQMWQQAKSHGGAAWPDPCMHCMHYNNTSTCCWHGGTVRSHGTNEPETWQGTRQQSRKLVGCAASAVNKGSRKEASSALHACVMHLSCSHGTVWLGHPLPDMSRNHEPDACTTAVGASISSASRKHADSLLPHKAVK